MTKGSSIQAIDSAEEGAHTSSSLCWVFHLSGEQTSWQRQGDPRPWLQGKTITRWRPEKARANEELQLSYSAGQKGCICLPTWREDSHWSLRFPRICRIWCFQEFLECLEKIHERKKEAWEEPIMWKMGHQVLVTAWDTVRQTYFLSSGPTRALCRTVKGYCLF